MAEGEVPHLQGHAVAEGEEEQSDESMGRALEKENRGV